MPDSVLRVEETPPLARLTLDRPAVHNALDGALLATLDAALARLADTPAVGVVVLAGAGPSFCAGADLAWLRRAAGGNGQPGAAGTAQLAGMLLRLAELPQPTIARVHGAVVGGGNGLVAACDFVLAAPGASFRLSEVKLGLAPAVISPFLLRRWGGRVCRDLFLTGRRIDAALAVRLGIADRLLADEEALDAAIVELAARLLEGGPCALAAAKQLLRRVPEMPLAEATGYTAALLAELRAGPEAQEGMRAFLEKRPPAWRAARGFAPPTHPTPEGDA